MRQYHLNEIAKIVDGTIHGKVGNFKIDPARISTDTRVLKRGDLFLALSGPNYDGNNFVNDAFRKGALGAIASRDVHVPSGKFVIQVKDTVAALQKIAAYHRSHFRIPVIAVTGSNGKTTVKDMIWTVLSSKYNVMRSEGTKNNHIGVPQAILKLNDRHDVCVLELGTNHKGEIRALGMIACPTIVVVTNIGQSHLESLGSLEGVFAEKREIFETFDKRVCGTAFLNGDDSFLGCVKGRSFKVVKFGMGENNDLRAAITANGCSSIDFSVNGRDHYSVKLLGRHNIYNAIAAIAVGRELGINAASIKRSLSGFKPVGMRLNLKSVNGFHIINDTYNSNPLSMEKALEVIKSFPAISRWVVSGDMLELGSVAAKSHKAVGDMVAASEVKGLLTIGELSRHTFDRARKRGINKEMSWHCSTHDEIVAILRMVIGKGDVVLIKGSRGMQMERIAEKLENFKLQISDSE